MEQKKFSGILSHGEAVFFFKKLFLVLIILLPSLGSSQIDVNIDQLRSMDESKLLIYYKAAKAQGYTTDQIIEFARLKGASPSEIMQIKDRIKSLESSNDNQDNLYSLDSNTSNIETTFGIQPSDKDSLDLKFSPVYGSEFFNNPKVEFTPSMQLATPEDYQLGPGDKLVVELYGASASTYELEISTSGTISIEGIAPVFLNGRTLKSAKSRLTQALSSIYKGLNSTDPTTKVSLDVNLQKARTILVQVVGQVNVPGTYALSGYSTPINALYAAAGINFNGSFREITLRRASRVIENIDLYEFFSKGKQSRRLLRDGDIIFVPFYKQRVEVLGAVKKRGLFELKDGESLEEFKRYYGGFLPSADNSSITIDRQINKKRQLLTYSTESLDSVYLKNGDRIIALDQFSTYENKITIQGAVVAPGDFSIDNTKTVGQLIAISGGLQRNAVKSFATLYREANGIERQIKTLNLMENDDLNFPLLSGDRLVVYDQLELEAKPEITIEGEINLPGRYPFYSGMQLTDIIAVAGGLKNNADNLSIAVYSNISDGQTQKGYKLKGRSSFSLTQKNSPIEIQENDVIVVGVSPKSTQPEFVQITGEVLRPGYYLIEDLNASINNLINTSGLTKKASLSGIYILRNTQRNYALNLDKQLDSLSRKNQKGILNSDDKISDNQLEKSELETENILKIPIDLNNKNELPPTLISGDIIVVEKVDANVTIKGEVQQETVASASNNLKSARYYVEKAGGFSPTSKRKNLFVVNQNGKISSTKSFLFFKFYPKAPSGSTIIVPPRSLDKSNVTIQEVLGIATSLATFGIIIDRLSQ